MVVVVVVVPAPGPAVTATPEDPLLDWAVWIVVVVPVVGAGAGKGALPAGGERAQGGKDPSFK